MICSVIWAITILQNMSLQFWKQQYNWLSGSIQILVVQTFFKEMDLSTEDADHVRSLHFVGMSLESFNLE